MVVGERGDLRQVGHDDHLRATAASRASRRPISTAACPPTPASTSSKTKVGHRVACPASDDLDREHHPRELAAGRALAQRPRLASRRAAASSSSTSSTPWRAEAPRRLRAVDLEPALVGGALEPGDEAGVRHRELVQLGGDRRRERVGRLRRRRGELLRPRGQRRAQLRALRTQGLDALVGAVELEQPLGGDAAPLEHLVERLAVLPGQRGQLGRGAPGPPRAAAGRSRRRRRRTARSAATSASR